MRLVLLTCLLSLPAVQAMAACPGETQVEMDTCAGNDAEAADKALNHAYASIMSRLKGNDTVRTRLVAAERAWIGFRDAECAFVGAGVEGGSIQPMIVTQCRTGLTRKRLAELTGYLSCQEGDLSCPVPHQ